ncbi:MAG: metal-dependent transcriptional regulator [Solirubrobacteraceae bacterium]
MPAYQNDRPIGVAVEDYVKTIFALADGSTTGIVTTQALAARLDVSAASASAMMRKLEVLALVALHPYHGVALTPAGTGVALEVLRHHRLLELFLAQELGLSWDKVHDEAEVLEHAISEELEALIALKLGNPTVDPHGDPIPSDDGRLEEEATVVLEQLDVGNLGTLVRVSDADPEVLRYLDARGIRPGGTFEVVDKQPFGGPLFARFGGAADVHPLGPGLTRAMRVRCDA